MMNIDQYISSGIIEEYCLGLLSDEAAASVERLSKEYPEIDLEIIQTIEALTSYSSIIKPRPELKTNILNEIKKLEEEQFIDLSNPPFIHKHSNYKAWIQAVKGLAPNFKDADMDYYFIKDVPDFQLFIAWLNDELVEEGHSSDEFQERLLILEGTCECNIGGQIVQLQQGDFLEIPQNTQHAIRNTSPAPQLFVKALVQRRKIA